MTGFERKPQTEQERALVERARALYPTGLRSTSIKPEYMFVVKDAQGSRIRDVSGNEYVDYLLGSGPMFLGHAHPSVVEAVRARLEGGSSYLMLSEPAIELAQEIVDAVPCAEMLSLHSTGTEATFFAMRLARAYRKKDKILKFEGGYHGMSDYGLMSTQWTFNPADFPNAVPSSHGIPKSLESEVLVAPYNNIAEAAAIIDKHREELACVIVEPMQRTILPADGFLQGLRNITHHYDIPLIFDEVVTGFRLAFGGAQERYGVIPDLCALGKTISGGHPLSVLCGKQKLMSIANPLRRMQGLPYTMQTGTFSANPLSTVAALAVISELKKPGVYDKVEAIGMRLMHGLQSAMDNAGVPAQVTGEPSVFQVWFSDRPIHDHRSSLRADVFQGMRFSDLLLDKGILKAHEKFFVSTVHDEDDVERTLAAFDYAAEQLAAL